MTDLNYKDELEIDELDLVASWMVQAARYGTWSELWAEASHKVDKLTEKRKVRKATVYSDVKLNPDKYNWTEEKSPTEGFIDSQIRMDNHFKKITSDLIKAKREMYILQSAKEAFYHRRKALESLSQLFTTSYYVDGSSTKTSRKLDGEAAAKAQKQALKNRKGGKDEQSEGS